jgi:NifU-like protein involved in Fe-S cluster formation
MKLQIRVDEHGVISDVKFKTFGCGSAIASSSYMTERVKGMTLEQAGNVKNTEIAKELCLPPVKRELRIPSQARWKLTKHSPLFSFGRGCHQVSNQGLPVEATF